MATIVNDTFTTATGGSGDALTAHTPDTGQQWVQVAQVNGGQINLTTANGLRPLASGTMGQLCKSQPSPAVNQYDVSIKIVAVDTGTSNRPFRLHARMTDIDNYYGVVILPSGNAANDTELYKVVGGTRTSLASVDTGYTVGDIIKLEIRDAAKKVYKNGVEILTSSDNALTAAGDAGVSMGSINAVDTGSTNTASSRFDDYSVVTVDTPAVTTASRSFAVVIG